MVSMFFWDEAGLQWQQFRGLTVYKQTKIGGQNCYSILVADARLKINE